MSPTLSFKSFDLESQFVPPNMGTSNCWRVLQVAMALGGLRMPETLARRRSAVANPGLTRNCSPSGPRQVQRWPEALGTFHRLLEEGLRQAPGNPTRCGPPGHHHHPLSFFPSAYMESLGMERRRNVLECAPHPTRSLQECAHPTHEAYLRFRHEV